MTLTKSKIEKWIALKDALTQLKKEEATLRQDLVVAIARTTAPGTYTLEQPFGTLKAVVKTNFTLDEAIYQSIHHKLTQAEIAAVKLKPELILKNFKTLAPTAALRQAVTEKPAMPTLTFTEAKK